MIKSTWRHPAPKMTVSQKNAVAIKTLIDTSKIPLRTLNICESLSISRGQFSASKPYLSGYKTIGCYWFAPETIEAATIKHEDEKRLITISRNKYYNKKRQA